MPRMLGMGRPPDVSSQRDTQMREISLTPPWRYHLILACVCLDTDSLVRPCLRMDHIEDPEAVVEGSWTAWFQKSLILGGQGHSLLSSQLRNSRRPNAPVEVSMKLTDGCEEERHQTFTRS